MRALLFRKILSDLRTSNARTANHPLNRTIRAALYKLIQSDRASPKALWAVKITRELWKRQIWTDAEVVNIMKEVSLADNEKVVIGGVRFFLGGDKEREELEDESSDEETADLGKLRHQMGINKKTKKKAKAMENAIAAVKRKEHRKKQPHPLNFSAFHLLHDPQGFAKELFSKHLQNTKSKLNLEQRLLVLQLVSRLIGLHKLVVLEFYSYVLKYLTPRQPSVTTFLASLAQATHSLVPPEDLEPLVQKIANEFVSEAAAAEVASSGLNAIREICVRQPQAINDTLLQDLVMYRKSKDKGVSMAAKGLLSLYRTVGPDLLKRRDRGKEAAMGLRSGEYKEQRFGEEIGGGIEGIDLLEKWKEEERQRKRVELGLPADAGLDGDIVDHEEEENEGGWELDDDESDDTGGWINVESDKEISISDSDDGEEPLIKRLKQGASPRSLENNKENRPQDEIDLIQKSASDLATTQILTPADLAKLHELRLAASISKHLSASKQRNHTSNTQQSSHLDDPLTAASIEGLAALSKKASRADKIALAQDGKTDRGKHQSTQARRKEKKEMQGKSTTNREKARKKNFLMTLGKAKGKQKKSLVERGKVLKAHLERGKRGGKRGNKGM